jgi:hypothetical protein
VRRLAALAIAVVLLTACETTGAKSIGPGKHTVTKPLRGLWSANDAQPWCKWTLGPKGGDGAQQGNEKQSVLIGTGNLGMTFWTNDKCGKWTR